ncbi:MAG: hypothetical protein MUP33_00635 [Polaromonas sp.]|nr:hypothetical protein [Polaromonas sp.]
MSNADNPSFPDFGKLVPGFDFLQSLTRQAAASSSPSASSLPAMGGWVAPTLNVEDLDKRIQELKAVQFWLDQNAAALKATIQALELQKMTLATLKGMNFSMAEVANAFKLKTPDSVADKPKSFAGFEIPPSAFQAAKSSPAPEAEPPAVAAEAKPDAAPAPAAGVVDPMQWWGALTQQFQTIAADAMKEAAKKSALDTETVKKARDMAAGMAKGMAASASKTVGGGARAAIDTALRGSQAWPTPVAAKTASRARPEAAAKAAPKAPARKAAARKTPRQSGI